MLDSVASLKRECERQRYATEIICGWRCVRARVRARVPEVKQPVIISLMC